MFYPDLSLTTLEYAVGVLADKNPDFDQYGPATIMLTPTRFPEFSIRILVSVWGGQDAHGNRVAIGMASASFFTARQAIRPGQDRYSIEVLDQACVDRFSNVTCLDGRHLYDVRLEAEDLRGELRPAEWRALEFCVAMHEGRTGTPERIKSYPELAARLNGFLPRSTKAVIGYIRDNQATGDGEQFLGTETLRSALRMMGLRRPKHGIHSSQRELAEISKRTQFPLR